MKAAAGRVFLVVLDGVGVGEAPDAAAFGDAGSDSVGNTARALGALPLPHLGRLGLGHLTAIPGTPPDPHPLAAWGKAAEISAGKDSTTGHWEMCGIVTLRPFPTYPHGFPPEVLLPFGGSVMRPRCSEHDIGLPGARGQSTRRFPARQTGRKIEQDYSTNRQHSTGSAV